MDLTYGYCSACLKIATEDDKLIKLNDSFPGEVTFHSKLIFCVSQMILENLETSALCKPCSAALETTFTFKSMCLNNIKKLRYFKTQVTAVKVHEGTVENAGSIKLNGIPSPRTPDYDNNKCNSEKTVQTEQLQSINSSTCGNHSTMLPQDNINDGGRDNLHSFDLNSYTKPCNSFDLTPPRQKKESANENSHIESVKFDLDNLLSVSLAGSSYFNKSTSELPPEKVRSEHPSKKRKRSLSASPKKGKTNSTSIKIANKKLSDEELIKMSCKEIPGLNNCSPKTLKCAIMLNKVDLQSSPKPNPKPQGNLQRLSSLKCNICRKTFTRSYHMASHMLQHLGMTPFRCNECEDSFYGRDKLVRHYKSKHNINANLKYDNEMKEMYEVALDMVENYLSADVNGKSSTKQLKKPQHTINNQQKDVKSNAMNLRKNISSVKKSQSLNHNAQSKTNQVNKPKRRLITCKVCSSTYFNQGDYIRHKKEHLLENTRPSPGQSSNLQKKKKRKKYFCPICNREFSESDHKNTHTGEKPYKCTKCDNRFGNRSNLYKHLLTHSSTASKKYTQRGKKPETKAKSKLNEIQNEDSKVETESSPNDEAESDLETTTHETYKCKITENELQMDVCQNVTDESIDICKVCEDVFSDVSSLTRHVVLHAINEGAG